MDSSYGSNKDLVRARLIKTCLMPLAYLSFGLVAAVKGPSMLDLQELQHCSIQALSTAMMFMPLGIILGSITGAVLTDRFTRWADLGLAGCCLLLAVSTAAVPWSPNLETMATLFGAAGISQGNINVVCSSLTTRMWGKKAASPIIAIHTFHSVGMLIAAPLTGPFLSKVNSSDRTTNQSLPHFPLEQSAMLDMDVYKFNNDSNSQTRVFIPYGIIGGVGILASCSFLAFHCLSWTFSRLVILGNDNGKTENGEISSNVNQKENGDALSPATSNTSIESETSPILKWVFRITLFICYTSIMYRDSVLSIFLFSMGHNSNLHMSKPLATILNTSWCGAYAFGRGASIIYSRFIHIGILLFTQTILALVLCALLAWLGLNGEVQLWILVCLLAVCVSPTYPTIMAWANHYTPITGLLMAFIDVGIGVGNFSATWISGYVFDHYGPKYIFYLMLGFAVLLMVILTCLQIYAHFATRKNTQRIAHGSRDSDEMGCNNGSNTVDENTPLIN